MAGNLLTTPANLGVDTHPPQPLCCIVHGLEALRRATCQPLQNTSGYVGVFWIISKQSAQLPHLAASRILDALPNPIPPKVRSIDAAIFAFNGTGPIWSTLCKHCTNCSSWCEANSRVSSSRIVLNRKFALAAKQQEQPSGLDVLDVGNHLRQSVMFDPFLRQRATMTPDCPTGAPNTVRPCSLSGNLGSPRQTTTPDFSFLAAAVRLEAPVGSRPPRFQIWVLP